jgi:hypothetical protein
MSDDAGLPLLFLDVDGPLVPFGGEPMLESWQEDDGLDGYLGRLTHELGARLTALPCRLVWATAWEEDANLEIAPRIGLPRLPVVTWPRLTDERVREDDWFGLHWKTRALVEWAAGRAFAWVDDELTEADRRWVAENHPARALLLHVESARGLADEDFEALDAWLRQPPG